MLTVAATHVVRNKIGVIVDITFPLFKTIILQFLIIDFILADAKIIRKINQIKKKKTSFNYQSSTL